jgi:hypothetical protein
MAVGICSLSIVASLNTPAHAKGEGFVVIRGPHLTPPIILRDPAETAAFFWGAGTGEQYRMDPPDRSSGLGPRYTATFVYGDVAQPPRSIRQYVYPLAEAGEHGMWVFTPRGQHWYGGAPLLPGWWILSVDAERVLEGHGLKDALLARQASTGHFRQF